MSQVIAVENVHFNTPRGGRYVARGDVLEASEVPAPSLEHFVPYVGQAVDDLPPERFSVDAMLVREG